MTEKNPSGVLSSCICGYTIKQILIALFALIVIPIIVSVISFNYQYSNSKSSELKSLSNGYISDLDFVNRSLSATLSTYNDPNSPDYNKPTKIVTEIYPNWGLYYSNRQDIQKFDPELSSEIYEFYSVLLSAEDNRVLFNNYEILLSAQEKNSPATMQNFYEQRVVTFNHMINYMEWCQQKLPKLMSDLKQVRDS